MRNVLILFAFFTAFNAAHAQRTFTSGNKKMMGGPKDFSDYRFFGLQLSAGPTFMFKHHPTKTVRYSEFGGPYDLTTEERGIPGGFFELGLVHYFKKRSKLSERLKYTFIDYLDWGIGVAVFNGKETTQIDVLDPISFNVLTTENQIGHFSNLFVTGRIAVHKNFYIGKKYFIDNGFGINVWYNVHDFQGKHSQDYTQFVESAVPGRHYFHHPLAAHFHYELGFGIKINRRSTIVFSAQLPVFGFHEWRGGATALKWFDSNYYPMQAKVRWTYLFKQSTKGCAPARVNDQDKETMRNN